MHAALKDVMKANMTEHVTKLNHIKRISLREALHQLTNVFKETMKHATQNRKAAKKNFQLLGFK